MLKNKKYPKALMLSMAVSAASLGLSLGAYADQYSDAAK